MLVVSGATLVILKFELLEMQGSTTDVTPFLVLNHLIVYHFFPLLYPFGDCNGIGMGLEDFSVYSPVFKNGNTEIPRFHR